MKKWRWFGKVAALACSVLLLGAYVFVRAGGKLWPTATDDVPPRNEPMFFSGSKFGAVPSVQPPTEDAQRGIIMVGSKSAIVFESEDSAQSAPPQPAPPAPNQAQAQSSQP
jgi:hypothetical protein